MSAFILGGPVEHYVVGHLATTRAQVRTACGQLIPADPPPDGTPRCPDCADWVAVEAAREALAAERDRLTRQRADEDRANAAAAAAIARQADALDALRRRRS
jgi:hypothetical protein